jgi:hypothetical protein
LLHPASQRSFLIDVHDGGGEAAAADGDSSDWAASLPFTII